MTLETTDVCIIGAGPAGAVAAALLRRQGLAVTVLERQLFPRFSIGESLLPQSMAYIEKAGLLQDVVEAGFQFKNGAAFCRGPKRTAFDFRDKFTPGWGTTYQVQRAHFDQVLANGAAKAGADVRYRHEVTAVRVAAGQRPQLDVQPLDGGAAYTVEAGHLLDASGFGRTLPRLLDLETPSSFPVRAATFTHVQDRISDPTFDRTKILVTVHPDDVDVWFWTIPFSNGRCSLGVVARAEYFDRFPEDATERLKAVVAETPTLATLLKDAVWDTPANKLQGYAANVKSLWGPGFALLGNAGEFLDPVFSSGVTIAVKSADLAVTALLRERAGEAVDWEKDYAKPLRAGVDAFRAFVESWYRGGFQDVIFHQDQNPDIRRMISSILAGYAWDLTNPYVAHPERMRTLEQLCAP
ncbi:NAD(P)/FAD-dependent oxidoreductase [Pelomonas sp. Root1237]|uniref:NAD(P)/FAD-dependent oxidoreductase n=1 Tax=Pelomonas sp. Root1237 TaxID=1736434 RepID=UPI0006FBC173|nr:tryptophan 7-halogenase [Pelomonas sp. Root1237]KQV85763.1 FAD-dependent oxidoreductase [Pelomonas sp. Root1237]